MYGLWQLLQRHLINLRNVNGKMYDSSLTETYYNVKRLKTFRVWSCKLHLCHLMMVGGLWGD